jgi:hypothetical protein
MCGTRGHDLPPAVDMMERIILAQADDMAAGGIPDEPAFIAQSACQRLDFDASRKTGQGADAVE